ncbi:MULTISPECIES: CAP family protein [unclassified Leptolyngbya]|uniref:CAP family protein n=1 Tax=unclassified Leptolyngbya TaxID=2650499 RepID=UPI001688D3AC|nr:MULTISPECIES: CAP family protein [unclassified Leptolyngbya]MBD1913481.1 secretion protein [Leptolyngbya sp. FACHB-8]MBD2154893.1 secretion protein [Leptolyngbya sp. FACHB-16]
MGQQIGVSLVGLVGGIFLGSFSIGQVNGQSALDLATFRSDALAQHNTYRANHHAPALTSSNALNTSAQRWADRLAATGEFEHSGTNGVGENLYVSYTTASSIDAETLANGAVKSWYDEVSKYDYGNPGFSPETGHFTQVVWKGSTELGCGTAQGTATLNGTRYNAFYVVCQYAPAGNVQGQFAENVLRP